MFITPKIGNRAIRITSYNVCYTKLLRPTEVRGAAFGLRQSLDTVGAFLGPLLGVALMLLWNDDFRAVFWVAVIPGFLAVALLFVGVREPEHFAEKKRTNPIKAENRNNFV